MGEKKIYFAGGSSEGFFWLSIKSLYQENIYLGDILEGGRPPSLSFIDSSSNEVFKNSSIFIPALNERRITKHFLLNILPKDAISAVNAGNCKIYFDYSNEAGKKSFFDCIVECCQEVGISNFDSIHIIGQNRLTPKTIQNGMHFHHYDYYIVYAWIHAMRTLSTQFETELLNAYSSPENRANVLCLNATPKLHRILAILYLLKYKLVEPNLTKHSTRSNYPLLSFLGFESTKSTMNMQQVKEWLCEINDNELAQLLEDLEPNLPLVLDQSEKNGNLLAFEIQPDLYLNSLVSVVTETEMFPDIQRITEKTFKPISLGHPTFVIGYPNTTECIKELGFKIHDEWTMQHSDTIPDRREKIEYIIQSTKRFTLKLRTDKDFVEDMRSISKSNISWTKSGFISTYLKKFAAPLLMEIL